MPEKKRVVVHIKKPKVVEVVKESKRAYKSRKKKELEARGLSYYHFAQNIEKFTQWVRYCKDFRHCSPNARLERLIDKDLKAMETEQLLRDRGIISIVDGPT